MSVPTLEELTLLHANICQALGDPKRIQILYALSEHSLHVTALAEKLDTPQPTISRHLRILRQRGLVDPRREGPAVIYQLADQRMITILDSMRLVLRDNLEKQSRVLA